MIRNYLTMVLGFPILLFAGNCCLGSPIKDVEINAHLNVEEQITLTQPDINITLLHQPNGNSHGVNNIAYAGLSDEFQLTSNIDNPEYKIQCTPADIDTQNNGKQNYQGYLYQSATVNTTGNIMQQEVIITHNNHHDSNIATFQLLFVLPSGVNYKTGSHSSTTTCTISA